MPKALKYDTGGKAHWVLERLTERPHSREELFQLAEPTYGRKARGVVRAAGAMYADGYVVHRNGGYEITPAGEGVLTILREGRDVYPNGQPSVRVFERRAA